jgi:ATP adenylyltransferase
MALVQRAVTALSAEYRAEGFNIGLNQGRVAGAGIADHLHVHVVPRWNGDVNFMSVVGDTRVLPEALAATWDRLKGQFVD